MEQRPKYVQIKEYIRSKIQSGELAKGSLIASETKLCEQFETSRITVVRAINDLVQEGYVRRKKGKGTYVAQDTIQEGVVKFKSFTERFAQGGHRVTTRVIRLELTALPTDMKRRFPQAQFTQALYLQRLRYVDDVPFCVQHAYLDPRRFHWILEEDLNRESLFGLAEGKHGMIFKHGQQTIGVGKPSKEDCEWLELDGHEASLEIFTEAYDEQEQLVMCDYAHYRADRYEFQIDMTR